MTHLRAFGLEVDLPAGWDGEIYRRPGDATTSRRDAVSGKGTANAVAHLANFPLPAERGDYDRALSAVRAGLGEAGFAAAWRQGRAMTLEESINYALTVGRVTQFRKPT